ncbi:MAG: Nramp family divalent metal transporter [Parcubacteria group bacterium]|nr:Nramp family divalent metal transporter [Parcubacteria group bacterium]
MSQFPDLPIKELPEPVHWKKAIGVGIVVTGLAIGTGELILWPHVILKYGLSFIFLGVLGFYFQYILNREVARLALATGESFFTTSARYLTWIPFFWIPAAVLLYIWPGWASSIGTILVSLFGFGTHIVWAWVVLGLLLVITFLGKRAYTLLERTLFIIVPLFFTLLVIVTIFNLYLFADKTLITELFKFPDFTQTIDYRVLFTAVVFAGAGGLLNLCVSLWYKDKGLGMALYSPKIVNPITGKQVADYELGETFEPTEENLSRWRGWMRYVQIDQQIAFLILGILTLLMLGINAFVVLGPLGVIPEGIQVASVQAEIFGGAWGIIGEKIFLLMTFLMLFSVTWTVLDALSRILTDTLAIHSKHGKWQKVFGLLKNYSASTLYYSIFVIVVLIGMVLVPLREPLVLLTISGVLGGFTMALYTPLLLWINNSFLPKELRPGWWTNLMLVSMSLLFLVFVVVTILSFF